MNDKADHFAAAWRIWAPAGVLPPEREFRFHYARKWRFDFAWPSRSVAVEVEGNAWHVRGGGRHMRDEDLEKYNAAAMAGWRILRFSPGMLRRQPDVCVGYVLVTLGVTP
ncbi:MAG: hypothetical protein E6Q97_30155 [Desulfurellales bacterium]|nr:MAG: hypothetical protein E6Q97_30155 [Desulfurellales bacterium]